METYRAQLYSFKNSSTQLKKTQKEQSGEVIFSNFQGTEIKEEAVCLDRRRRTRTYRKERRWAPLLPAQQLRPSGGFFRRADFSSQ